MLFNSVFRHTEHRRVKFHNRLSLHNCEQLSSELCQLQHATDKTLLNYNKFESNEKHVIKKKKI